MRGMLMADFNRTAEALASFEKAVALKPDYSKARWGVVHGGAADPLRRGERDRRAARRLRAAPARALRATTKPAGSRATCRKGLGMAQPFFLAYQGRNDRDLQSLFGGLATRIMADRYGTAELAPPPAPGEPIRVGIVSGFFYQHSVWKIGVRGWVTPARSASASSCSAITPAPSRTPRPRSPGSTATASCRGRTRPSTGGRSSSPTGRTS